MPRLIAIEWIKLKSYRPFWILMILYFVVLGLVLSGVMLFFEYVASRGAEFNGLDPSMIPFYDFADIWQNMTYLATFLKIFLGFIVVISITNEYSYKTIRQHVIDGLTRWELLAGKLSIILVITIVNTLFVLVLGLILGLIYSPVQGLDVMFENAGFLLAYFLDVFAFLTFALLVGMLIKRTGFAIVLLALYTLFLEPIAALILSEVYSQYTFTQYFPIRAINNLISVPFGKYVFQEVQDYIAFSDIALVAVYVGLFIFLSFRLLKARDISG
ncbi:MAG: ABC transporter permease [Bacteroidota bacterium]